MMVTNDWHDWIRKLDCGEDVCSYGRMHFHLVKFGIAEFARLVEYVLRYGQLTHIMEQCRSFYSLKETCVLDAEGFRQADCIRLNTAYVAVGDLVFGVYRHCQRFDC